MKEWINEWWLLENHFGNEYSRCGGGEGKFIVSIKPSVTPNG